MLINLFLLCYENLSVENEKKIAKYTDKNILKHNMCQSSTSDSKANKDCKQKQQN